MSLILTSLAPKAIAFGAVATGNINAHDADKVAGIISNNGSTLIAVAIAASIGSTTSVVAMFEVSSVSMVMEIQIIVINIHSGTLCREVSF